MLMAIDKARLAAREYFGRQASDNQGATYRVIVSRRGVTVLVENPRATGVGLDEAINHVADFFATLTTDAQVGLTADSRSMSIGATGRTIPQEVLSDHIHG